MAASTKAESAGELSDLRRKLIWRMSVAGIMIVGLLGGLAFFDYLSSRVETESEAVRYTEPVPVAKKTVTQPVTPIEVAPEPSEEKKPPPPEVSSAPVDKATPKLDTPPPSSVVTRSNSPKVVQGTSRSTGVTSPVAASGSVSPSPAASVKVAEPRSGPSSLREPLSTAPPLRSSPLRLFSGFSLQAGVFAEPRRAEELHARLILEGIPSSIEARVQVGPFNSKEEAEAARVKMKSMGIDAVMLMPGKLRR